MRPQQSCQGDLHAAKLHHGNNYDGIVWYFGDCLSRGHYSSGKSKHTINLPQSQTAWIDTFYVQLKCSSLLLGKGALSVAFVRPSHTLRITGQSKGLACPNWEWRFSTFDATRIPVSRSKGQRSRSPGPLMLTHIVRHNFRSAKSTNFKLGTSMEDDDPHQPQAWSPRSRSQGHVINLGLMLYLCH